MDLLQTAILAKRAAYEMMLLSSEQKNQILDAMASGLAEHTDVILHANAQDILAAKQNKMSQAMQDRLALTKERIRQMADGLLELMALPDPVGGSDEIIRRPNGLQIAKRRVPLGVIGIIYEARPNVTVDVVGICLKSGNSTVLRGGSEAQHSNMAIFHVLNRAGLKAGMPEGAIGMPEDASRAAALQMMKLNEYIDVLIPRGGAGLIQSVVKNATVPVIETGTGNCHIYIDSAADLAKAERIVLNAKCTRPSVCNAAEKLLIARDIAEPFLQQMNPLFRAKGIEIHGEDDVIQILSWAKPIRESEWGEEYLDLVLGIKIVDDMEEAIVHINRYGTKHSEAIITENYTSAQAFLDKVDAAAVYVNASTRFTDGGEFGFGAEMGISTQKIHARGPMGLREMTTYKYCIYGSGQIR